MKGNRTGVINVHCKSSGKSCRGKTNIRTIFFGYTVSEGTFKQIYNVGSIENPVDGEVLLEIIIFNHVFL